VAVGSAAAARHLALGRKLLMLARNPAALIVALLLRYRAHDSRMELPVRVGKIDPASHSRERIDTGGLANIEERLKLLPLPVHTIKVVDKHAVDPPAVQIIQHPLVLRPHL